MTDEEKISRRYRELPREEPPRHLDDAILAAARRAVHTRPAPLVVPSGRQRWYFPLAAAAIIVLAVAVTFHIQLEQPAEEVVTAQSAPAEEPPSTREFKREEAPPAPQPERRREAESADSAELRDKPGAGQVLPELQKAPEPFAAPPPPPSTPSQDASVAQESVAGAMSRRMEAAKAAEPAAAPAAPQVRSAPRLAASAAQSPEQWLQGIIDLRSQGWHEEADRQLAEFGKRYPDYKIPKAARKN